MVHATWVRDLILAPEKKQLGVTGTFVTLVWEGTFEPRVDR